MKEPSAAVLETKAAVEYLIRVAEKNGYVVAGFVFGAGKGKPEPMLVNFGNCNDAGSERLFSTLCKQASEKREAGEAIIERILPIQ